jgi:GNAT superfamily N-acetyltransferase
MANSFAAAFVQVSGLPLDTGTTGDAVVTTQPVLRCLRPSSEANCQLLLLEQPCKLEPSVLARLFLYTAPYTGHAFGADPEDLIKSCMSAEGCSDRMTAEARAHFEHTLLGDCVLFAGDVDSEGGLLIFGHANLRYISMQAGIETEASDPQVCERTQVLYVNGICCDPLRQGRGIGSALMAEVVKFAQARFGYVTLRTMNLSIMRMMRRACSGTRLIAPIDCSAQHLGVCGVACAISTYFGWSGLDTQSLIFPKAYTAADVVVFMGSKQSDSQTDASASIGTDVWANRASLENRVADLMSREQGDAMLCVCDLSSP